MRDDQGERAQGQLAAISGLDDQVRRRLCDYVRGHSGPVSRDEAAEAAGIGRPLAAYHLDKLVDLGLLTADYLRPADRRGPGAGRPAKVYAPSAREFAVTVPPRDYELAARLMPRQWSLTRAGLPWPACGKPPGSSAASSAAAWRPARRALRQRGAPRLRGRSWSLCSPSMGLSPLATLTAALGFATARSTCSPPGIAVSSAA